MSTKYHSCFSQSYSMRVGFQRLPTFTSMQAPQWSPPQYSRSPKRTSMRSDCGSYTKTPCFRDKTSIPSKYCQSLCGLYPEASIFAYHGCVFCGKRCVWCVARNDIWEEMACSLETPEVGQLEAYSFHVGVVIFHSCRDGIRQYLEDMECQFSEGEKAIPHWAQDYRKLRGLRRTRNTLAHNVSEYQVCTEQDVENVIDFVDRIMQQQDPLAMLNLYNSRDEESETMDESEVSVPDKFYYDVPRNEKNGKQLLLGVVLLVITCVLVILVSILISHIV